MAMSFKNLRVLVVDDQQTIRALVRNGLMQLGCSDVAEAPDGEVALRTVLTRPVDLVITDFNMPKLDGIGLLRAIRAHPPTKSLAVIMLTGSADRELVQKAVQNGVNNLLVKPFTVATLKGKIEAVFGAMAA